jgi:hypothetical protein
MSQAGDVWVIIGFDLAPEKNCRRSTTFLAGSKVPALEIAKRESRNVARGNNRDNGRQY